MLHHPGLAMSGCIADLRATISAGDGLNEVGDSKTFISFIGTTHVSGRLGKTGMSYSVPLHKEGNLLLAAVSGTILALFEATIFCPDRVGILS